MFGKWNQVLLYIFALDFTVLEQYYSVVFLTVFVPFFVIWRKGRISDDALWVSCKERHTYRFCIIYKIDGKIVDVFPYSAFRIISGMPSHRRNESCLRPDDEIRICGKRLSCISLEIVEIASIGFISALP